MRAGVFVTGTDTDVGKTLVAAGLLRALVRRGVRALAYKPVEAGAHTDARVLWEASGRSGAEGDVCLVRLALPAAPSIAAREEGKAIRPEELVAGFQRQAERADVVVVEGAGGLLVPIASGFLVADLARELGLPLLVVARDALGTINHTLLTVEAARARDMRVSAVLLNRLLGDADPTTRTNQATLGRLAGVPVVGPFPRLEPPSVDAAADALSALGVPEALGLLGR